MGENYYNLTAPQKSIWLTEQYYKNTNINNVCGTFYSNECLNFETLKKALNIFLQNNDSFKIKLHFTEDKVSQYFSGLNNIDFPIVDIKTKEEQTALEEKLASKVFSMLDSLLFEIVLFRYPDNHGGFVINSHHIISDSWTNGIVANDVALIYSKVKNNEIYEKSENLSYKNYISSEEDYVQSEKFQKDKKYWNDLFATIPEVATIPSIKDTFKNQDDLNAKRMLLNLDKELFKSLKEYCDRNKVSFYNFFMTIFSLYLGRVSNLDEFVIGTPILNRTNFKEKQTTGMFINTLPLKITLSHEKTFLENLKDIAVNSMSLLRHQKYSYQYLIEDLRKRDSNLPMLYKVAFSYQITKMNENMDALNHTTSWTFNNTIADDLDIHMFEWNENNSIQIAYDYRTNKYDEQDISDLHARILHIINQVLNNENILLKDIEIVTPEEKHKILYEFNNTKVDYPKDKTISQIFEKQAKLKPNKPAISFEGKILTYQEFNEKSNQLARYLKENDVKAQDNVLILADKSIDMYISIMAVLKLGALYVPVDSQYPQDRINTIIEDCNPKIVIVDNKYKDLVKNEKQCTLPLDNLDMYSKKDLECTITPDDGAYIIYTSGSSGKPKGVVVPHKGVVRLVINPNYIKFEETDRILQNIAIVFDASTFAIFGSLLNGLTLYPITKEQLLDFAYLEKYIKENKINIINSTVSFFNKLIEFNPKIFSEARVILIGGEEVLPKTVNICRKENPNVQIVNVYGPTENSNLSCCHIINQDYERAVPIGIPVSNSSCYILDKYQNILPTKTHGEIYVGGDGVAIGYLNNPDMTNEKFIPNPFAPGRLYKTGDLGYWDSNGNIQFLSRIDNQVKIRGFRIELKEIEKQILDYGNIQECAVIVTDNNNSKMLLACIGSKDIIDTKKLNSFLKEKLPSYMVPTKYICLESLPLNINGKLDTKLLKSFINTDKNKNIIPNRNSIDRSIVDILSSILSITNVSIEDSFFELGGDSLSAISFASELSNELSTNITVQDIFKNPVIKDLSDYISTLDKKYNLNSIKKAKKMSYYPISSAQKRIYYSSSLENNSTLYNIAGGIIVDKLLDVNKLQECFNILINRHESLRTHFDIINDEVIQVIDDHIDFELPLEDVNSDDLNKIYHDFVKPFDLSKAPLFRCKLIKLKDDKMLLLLDMHHIISDGTSLSILLQELCDLYNGLSLPEKHIDYKDFTLWEKDQFETDEFKKSKEYWLNQFNDEIPLLNMPTTSPRPSVQSFEGSNYHTKLSKDIFDKVNKVSKELNITPYMLMLSAYYILLSKYTSQDDIVIGTPIIGRELPELSNILGMFVNTLALRNKIDHNLTFEEFSKSIKENCLNSFKNQSYPFDMLVKDLNIKRDTSRNPLFDVMFVYQNNGYTKINFKDAGVKYFVPDNSISKFDLTLEIIPIDNEYSLRFEYCTKLFNEDFIKRLSSHYINILTAILENNEIKIADIDMLSKEEKHQILYEFNNTKVDYPKDKTIIDLFEEQVERTPDNIAVVFEDQKLTYRELNEKANQMSRYLIANNVQTNTTIGIMIHRSLYTTILMLSSLKIGATYVLIDSDLPKERINYMLNNSNCSVLVLNNTLSFNTNINTLYLEDIVLNLYDYKNLNIQYYPDNIFTILYTSGSTGVPKGVMLHNQGMINLVLAHKLFMNTDICDTYLSFSTISFDMFQVETFVPLLNGKTIILTSDEEQKSPISWLNKIKKYDVNFILSTPSKLKLLLDNNNCYLPSLKVIQLGGEKLISNIVDSIRKFSSAHIYDAYGPSEITACCSCKEILDDNIINIGKPICNMKIIILDKYHHLCPINVPGEIYVSGIGLSNGYMNNMELTNSSFVYLNDFQNTFYKTGDIGYYDNNGDIFYIGRNDFQVKLHGLRIELSEIEAKILEFNNISRCGVVYKDSKYLSAFFTSVDKIDIKELREFLITKLPLYMIPKYITQVPSLPLNNNGKIDKKLLLNYNESTTLHKNIVKPQNSKEKICCNIWSQLLGNEIGITDDIFENGADSLLAIQFKTQMMAQGINVTYSDIFKHPKIADFCKNSSISEPPSIPICNPSKINELLQKNDIKKLNNLEIIKNNSNNVLLLGSNGFIGMHIIYNFIKNDNGKIYCIVRDRNKKSAESRFLDTLKFYFGEELNSYINNRIFILKGNVLKDNFDLSNNNINFLKEEINVVINAAALVKHYGREDLFKSINVDSTKIAVDFCNNFDKRLLHISSLSVSGNDSLYGNTISALDKELNFSEQNLYIGQNLDNLYIKSKFDAEQLVLENIINKNLKAQIFRLGNITSRFSDGKFQINPEENAFANKISSLIKLKNMPINLLSNYMEFTPVDICANVIVLLMQNYLEYFTVFHIYNNNHLYINTFIEYLYELNIPINIISESDFSALISNKLKDEPNLLSGIINDIKDNNSLDYSSNIKILSEFTRAFLYTLNFKWPNINKEYIKKYITYLYNIDFFGRNYGKL